MKFALVNGERREAQPKLVGECRCCGSKMIAKCGDVYAHHWAHKGRRTCDPWWENETEWHRAWKNCFPEDWQEIVQFDESGEKHIADVKTEDGWVIEFQHSAVKSEERGSREAFYKRLVWVIDGKRRKFDERKFKEAWEDAGCPIGPDEPLRALSFYEGRLLNEWVGRPVHVMFDFGEEDWLWWLIPQGDLSGDLVFRIARTGFVQMLGPNAHRDEHSPEEVIEVLADMIKRREIWHKIERSARPKRTARYDPLAIRRLPHRRM